VAAHEEARFQLLNFRQDVDSCTFAQQTKVGELRDKLVRTQNELEGTKTALHSMRRGADGYHETKEAVRKEQGLQGMKGAGIGRLEGRVAREVALHFVPMLLGLAVAVVSRVAVVAESAPGGPQQKGPAASIAPAVVTEDRIEEEVVRRLTLEIDQIVISLSKASVYAQKQAVVEARRETEEHARKAIKSTVEAAVKATEVRMREEAVSYIAVQQGVPSAASPPVIPSASSQQEGGVGIQQEGGVGRDTKMTSHIGTAPAPAPAPALALSSPRKKSSYGEGGREGVDASPQLVRRIRTRHVPLCGDTIVPSSPYSTQTTRRRSSSVPPALVHRPGVTVVCIGSSICGGSNVTFAHDSLKSILRGQRASTRSSSNHQESLFAVLGEGELHEVVSAMVLLRVCAGAEVIHEGERGDYFYVVREGLFEVTKRKATEHAAGDAGGAAGSTILQEGQEQIELGEAEVVVAEVGAGQCFGQLALIHGARRAASVRAKRLLPQSSPSPSTPPSALVWALDRLTFRRVMASASTARLRRRTVALTAVPELVATMTVEQLSKAAEAVREVEYAAGEVIVRKGDLGHDFFIVHSGAVRCIDVEGEDPNFPGMWRRTDVLLTKGQFFGERAILNGHDRREATVIAGATDATDGAVDGAVCLVLGRDDFERLLGPFTELLREELQREALMKMPLLRQLQTQSNGSSHSADAVKQLLALFRPLSVEPGELVVEQGVFSEANLYVVVKGDAEKVAEGKTRGNKDAVDDIDGAGNCSNGFESDDGWEETVLTEGQSFGDESMADALSLAGLHITSNSGAPANSTSSSVSGASGASASHHARSTTVGWEMVLSQMVLCPVDASSDGTWCYAYSVRAIDPLQLLVLRAADAVQVLSRAMELSMLSTTEGGRNRGEAYRGAPSIGQPMEVQPTEQAAIASGGTIKAGDMEVSSPMEVSSLRQLQCGRVLGEGSFGSVRIATLRARPADSSRHPLAIAPPAALPSHNPSRACESSAVFALKQVSVHESATRCDEGELLQAMNGHPLIVRLFATFVDDGIGSLCHLLELVSGGELAGVMERAMRDRATVQHEAHSATLFSGLPPASVRFYGACVVLMLEALHERRILYRDVKPENLLVDRCGCHCPLFLPHTHFLCLLLPSLSLSSSPLSLLALPLISLLFLFATGTGVSTAPDISSLSILVSHDGLLLASAHSPCVAPQNISPQRCCIASRSLLLLHHAVYCYCILSLLYPLTVPKHIARLCWLAATTVASTCGH
jgi:CRP-like cAMP-binding protein